MDHSAPDWFTFVKSRISAGGNMPEASAEYFQTYFPVLASCVDRIVQQIETDAAQLVLPDGYPYTGLQVISDALSLRLVDQ